MQVVSVLLSDHKWLEKHLYHQEVIKNMVEVILGITCVSLVG